MKISEMLQREDFYEINRKTLNDYFPKSEKDTTRLYVYPKLNAIVTKRPTPEVLDYLFTEYNVRNKTKRLLAKLYVLLCMVSLGMLSSNKFDINSIIPDSTLIYPCNKKYRIFDFHAGTVSVIIKRGFGTSDLMHEIEFRKRQNNPSFVPQIIFISENGYTEKIIQGIPVARVIEQSDFRRIKDEAYNLFRNYYKQYDREINTSEYITKLNDNIHILSEKKPFNTNLLWKIVSKLIILANTLPEVTIGFSHGDLQAGNIWIGNDGKIYIIDWESWGTRSIWYDYATLYESLRPGDLNKYLYNDSKEAQKALVLMEDLIFQLSEMNSLPEKAGISKFDEYIMKINDWLGRK